MPELDYNFGSDRSCLTCVKRFTRKRELWPTSHLTDSLPVEGVVRCVTNLSNMSDAWRKRVAARCWVTLEGRRLSLLFGADHVGLTVIELNYCIEQFDTRLNAVDEAQSAVERELDVALLEANIIEATKFRNRVHKARVRAAASLWRVQLVCWT